MWKKKRRKRKPQELPHLLHLYVEPVLFLQQFGSRACMCFELLLHTYMGVIIMMLGKKHIHAFRKL
jgi:hypothetical protein